MDYHIREISKNGKTVNVVFHLPIPDAGTNQAGISWRTAIVKSLGGADEITSVIPSIQGQQEETDMKAGAIVEINESVRFGSIYLSTANKKAKIEARYSELLADLVTNKQKELLFMGFSDNVGG